MESLVILAGLAFLANKVVTVVKAVAARDRNTWFTQVVVWVVAVGVITLVAQSDVFGVVVPPGFTEPLADFDFASLVLLGLLAGSSGSVVYDFKAALDGGDTAAEPRLLAPHTRT